MSGMGEDLDSAPTGDRPRVPSEAPVTTAFPQPGGFHDLLNAEFPETPDLDDTAVRIREFLAKGAHQVDAACQAFEQEIHDFRAERKDLHEDMKLLHANRVDPRSIDGMVEESIASRLGTINSDMLGVVSTLALIRDVQQSSAAQFAVLNASRHEQFDELNVALSNQHLMLVKMAENNQMRDAHLVKHSKRMDRMEILFERLDNQLPNLARCVNVCLEVGSSTTAIASTLTTLRDQTTITAQMVTQRLDNMEETMCDTFVDLKVDVSKVTLTLMENTIVSHFTAVDVGLAQLASPLCRAAVSDLPHSPAPPDFPTPPDADTDCPGSAWPTSDDGDGDAPPPNRFQATTTFRYAGDRHPRRGCGT